MYFSFPPQSGQVRNESSSFSLNEAPSQYSQTQPQAVHLNAAYNSVKRGALGEIIVSYFLFSKLSLIQYLMKLTESLLPKINLPLKYLILSHLHNFLYGFLPFNYRKETCYRNPIYIIYMSLINTLILLSNKSLYLQILLLY